jgi:LmbE family N-acetylglucosaminyl deacetylase
MSSQRKRLAALACLAALLQSSTFPSSAPTAARAQAEAVYSRGAAGLGQLLRRLQTTASALHTGAHPDDEDSALIARLARGESARVAYLSASRGEGGQNVIGPELFEPLGVIRTEELLQARRLDGGDQLFTRVFEYGFTKTLEETAQKWGERNVLGDMVRAIRLYRPLVVVSRFAGTPADGHGHHQLVGRLTPQAFRAAGDPKEFPEHMKEGLRPWQPLKLYVSQGFAQSRDNEPTLRLDTGVYDHLLGRTYYEIAAEGRSQHKSQEMGALELRGPQTSGVRLVESRVGRAAAQGQGAQEKSVFDGIDTSISGVSKLAGLPEELIGAELSAVQTAAARALADYNALDPSKTIAPLAEGLGAVRRARAKLAASSAPDDARHNADFLLAHKEREFAEALRRAAGVTVDALADAETVAPGESFVVALRAFLPEGSPARVTGMSLSAPRGWRVEEIEEPPAPQTGFRRGRETTPHAAFYRVTVPSDAAPTTPYWLEKPRQGYLFDWNESAAKNEPFAPPLLKGEAEMEIASARVAATQPVEHRYADDIRGELRRDINVVPALSLSLDPGLVIAPSSAQARTRRLAVSVTNNSRGEVAGTLRLQLPEGWKSAPAEAPFALKSKGRRTALVFEVTIPGGAADGEYKIGAVAEAGGRRFDRAMRVVSYPHIQTHRLYAPAVAGVRVFDLKVAPVKVGYIMGTGDAVPEAIARMGLEVTMLGEDELTTGDLSRFDTIVVGVRASQARPDFVANNGRLLDYVRGGGALIVQYQQQEYVQNNLPPYRAEMNRTGVSSARVTDENAPVKILRPEHPAFNFPNRITEADWEGWVQERNLYSFTGFGPEYAPLLEAGDPGEPPQRGGQLYAELGRGVYVYTSYAWFRQLPAGVPGAYRLFANLLSLPKAPRVPAPAERAGGAK